jgi:hypothetical protein
MASTPNVPQAQKTASDAATPVTSNHKPEPPAIRSHFKNIKATNNSTQVNLSANGAVGSTTFFEEVIAEDSCVQLNNAALSEAMVFQLVMARMQKSGPTPQ